jgi:hypothetical protein
LVAEDKYDRVNKKRRFNGAESTTQERRIDMAGKNTAAFGIYPNEASVRNGVETLEREGFRLTDISVLFPANEGTKDFAHEKGTKASEGAATGAGSGAIVGGVLGWLAGVGTIAIPGVGPFLAAGPIMAALAGAGAEARRADWWED